MGGYRWGLITEMASHDLDLLHFDGDFNFVGLEIWLI